MHYLSLATIVLSPLLAVAAPAAGCVGTIASLNDVAAAQKCKTINIKGFTVPAGKTFDLTLLAGTTVNMLGDVKFGVANWAGPLFRVTGTGITFNGNGHTFDGQGPAYWDGLGGNDGVTKPHPMMKIRISGTYTNVKVLNSPAHVYSVSNPAKLVMSKLTIDNSAGDKPNAKSHGKAAGHNTDGFDVSTKDLTIEDSNIYNQDDCIAINKGSNIIFQRNLCSGGHGISIGSVSTGATVQGVQILNNRIVNNDNGLRIKTKRDATNAAVSGITFSGNTASGIRKYGVIIDQGYPTTLGAPGNVPMSGINFVGARNVIAVTGTATRVAVNCGPKCSGTWNWSALTVTGGKAAASKFNGTMRHTHSINIYNQDDCIAINKGSNIIFQRNLCSGGHGISIGSVSTGATVQGVQILNNRIVNNDNGLRIKTKRDATNAAVSGITFSGNTASGIRKYGVIIDQGYPTTLGAPGNVPMSGINFVGARNVIAVTGTATRVAVNCGPKCSGTWNWSALTVTGGKAAASKFKYAGIKGGSF
ncbi:unnamed protein product [Rhizoctonia solani]|uniref:endo-polygalacturonase n=1 Tax=Rhizoctonia solani TaxID=456999 RepID=A0A8H3BZJ8_9AGAM|nr:unnamed protein product [Rhizoctonia solani]